MAKTSGQLQKEKRAKLAEKRFEIKNPTVCHYCKSTGLKEEDKYCANCGFPQGGTKSEMLEFIKKVGQKKKLLDDQKSAIRKARNVLYWLGGLNLLAGLAVGIFFNDFVIAWGFIIQQIIVAAVFIGLGVWCNKKPFPAILSGFFFYIVINTINVIMDPSTIFQGIIWKIIFISAFVYGYRAVKDSEKLKKELAKMKEATDLS